MKAIGRAAFDAIYEENIESVYKTALFYSGNHHAAEEVTQTVFMKLYVNIENVNLDAVNSWLLTAAKHMALNYQREIKREVLMEEVEVSDELVPYVPSSEDIVLQKLKKEERRELAGNIFSELYRVNPRWYEAVTITYFLEKPGKEVAEIMGVNLDTLYSMLYRAKRWIKKNYEEQYGRLDVK